MFYGLGFKVSGWTDLPNSQWETAVSAAGKSSTSLRFHSESLDTVDVINLALPE